MAIKGGAVILILFGSVFLAVGVGAAAFSVRTLVRAAAVKSWRETPATVLSCELRRYDDSDGGATYQVEATYQYRVDGVAYTGSRVSLHTGSDNVGDFHQRTYAALQRARDGVEATVCWVNPAAPADAVLVRKLRPEMLGFMQLFVLAFGGAGLAVVLIGLVGLLQRPEAEPLGGAGQIRMRGAALHRVAAGLALGWNGYVGWFLWQLWVVVAPEPLPWWAWLMAASGLLPAAWAAYLVLRIRKFGVSVFEMSPQPGVLGGPVSGVIRIPAKVEAEEGFDLVLQCIHQYTTGSGKNSTSHRDVLWETSERIENTLACGDETMLPVRFSVPYEKPATTAAGGSNGYYWQLKASAAASGIDYKAVFDVPVRHTPQSSQSYVPPAVPEAGASLEPVEAVIGRERLRFEPRPDGGFELIFPAGRQRQVALFLLIFTAAWTAVCVALWTVTKVPTAFALVFTVFEAFLIFGLWDALFVARGIAVDRATRACVVWRRAAGLPRREKSIPFNKILEIRSERAGQSGSAAYYRIVLVAEGGSPRTVGSGLRMWNDAEDVAKLLRAAVREDFVREGFRV